MTHDTPSPLRLVTRDPAVHELIAQLSAARKRILGAPEEAHALQFSRSHLADVRAGFNAAIRRGESTLHRLCDRLVKELMDGRCDKVSVVIAETPSTGERTQLEHRITDDSLYGLTDLALGLSVLERVRFKRGEDWVQPRLVANFVEYHPLRAGDPVIHKILSRIKAEEEVWNKVVDEIFDLDALVRRDKQLSRYSRFVKDVFGVKIVVGNDADAERVHAWLERACDDPEIFQSVSSGGEQVKLIETKNYLAAGKRTGWAALKSVVTAGGQTIELQIQPLDNHVRELQRLTAQSHAAFRTRREEVRDEVARALPLFGFYRSLLRWMFQHPDAPAPQLGRVRVELID
jgi:hypothetical protein